MKALDRSDHSDHSDQCVAAPRPVQDSSVAAVAGSTSSVRSEDGWASDADTDVPAVPQSLKRNPSRLSLAPTSREPSPLPAKAPRHQRMLSLAERMDAQSMGDESPSHPPSLPVSGVNVAPQCWTPPAEPAGTAAARRPCSPERCQQTACAAASAHRKAEVSALVHLLVLLLPLVGIVGVFVHIMAIVEGSVEGGLGVLCGALPPGVEGESYGGLCRVSLF